jgi:predicted HicB family RNase H-like nuclease
MMEYKGYIAKVDFDPDANLLHGEVAGIRDVVTFQGRSVAEIEKAFKDSVDDYLIFCRKRGEQPDKPCSGKFLVRLAPDLHRKVNMLASASGKSLNAWVADCLNKEAAAKVGKLRRSRQGTGKPKKHRSEKKMVVA